MPVQPQAQQRERVFGTDGNTIEEVVAEEVPEEVVEETEAVEETETPPAAPAAAAHKYRIGDKTFATQAEAITYAEGQVGAGTEVDAYRQALREVISQVPRSPVVTPVTPVEENADEIYTNPAEYLRKRDDRIKAEVLQQVNQQTAVTEADNRIWHEFSDRHPDLSDFREEIASLVGKIQPEVQAIGRTKGQAAAYDYVATKFKVHAERINAALKPKRALPNGAGGGAAGGKVETVTPKPDAKKPLSFSEQVRNLRKGR